MKKSFHSAKWLLAALFGATACTNTDHGIPNPAFPERIAFVAERQYPEGITFSPQLGRFLISSITQGKIGTVGFDGKYEDLLTDPQLISAIGIRERNGLLYVCNSDNVVSSKSTPATTGTTAELLVFNIATKQLIRRVDLDALLPNQPHLANDVAVDDQGNAYVTDSFSPVVYKVTAGGQASILVNSPLFAGQGFNLNGIVFHPNGYLIVAKTNQGKLFKIDLGNNNAISEITGFGVLPGDGLTLFVNDLYVVSQGSRVVQVRSLDNWQTANVIKIDAIGYAQATTNVEVGGKIYTLNARIGEIGAAAGNPALLQAKDYTIQQFK